MFEAIECHTADCGPIAHPPAFVNDNADWTTDARLAARVFCECRLRYKRADLRTMSPAARIIHERLLRQSLEFIRLFWSYCE